MSSNPDYVYPETQVITQIDIYDVERPVAVISSYGTVEYLYDESNNSVSISCMMLIESATLLELIY